MENFWQGNLVRLRAIEPTDAELFTFWNQDSERARSLDFLWPPQSVFSVKEWAVNQAKNKLKNGAFHWIIENLSGEAVGSISTNDCNPVNGTFSYGLDIFRSFQRRGYASAAIKTVLLYYFQELRYQKVTVPVHRDNLPSIRLHEKLGFQLEGRFRRMFYTHGGYIDIYWFGMTVEEFIGH